MQNAYEWQTPAFLNVYYRLLLTSAVLESVNSNKFYVFSVNLSVIELSPRMSNGADTTLRLQDAIVVWFAIFARRQREREEMFVCRVINLESRVSSALFHLKSMSHRVVRRCVFAKIARPFIGGQKRRYLRRRRIANDCGAGLEQRELFATLSHRSAASACHSSRAQSSVRFVANELRKKLPLDIIRLTRECYAQFFTNRRDDDCTYLDCVLHARAGDARCE